MGLPWLRNHTMTALRPSGCRDPWLLTSKDQTGSPDRYHLAAASLSASARSTSLTDDTPLCRPVSLSNLTASANAQHPHCELPYRRRTERCPEWLRSPANNALGLALAGLGPGSLPRAYRRAWPDGAGGHRNPALICAILCACRASAHFLQFRQRLGPRRRPCFRALTCAGYSGFRERWCGLGIVGR